MVFNIPAHQPFLHALARAVLAGDLPRVGGQPPDPVALSDITLLLPTRRAARALQETFLDLAGGRALLLPRVRAIAEVDEDQSLLQTLASPGAAGLDGDLPPGVGELERLVVLTTLVMRWTDAMREAVRTAGVDAPEQLFYATGTQTAGQAIRLARELAGLMDMIETENVSLTQLETLVPDDYSEHWQQTLKFLEIVSITWPDLLRARGKMSLVARRNALILAEADRLARRTERQPVIVAGVTGSIPVTAELMRVVARLEAGAIVLPGLDTELDDGSWAKISAPHICPVDVEPHAGHRENVGHPEHPQFGLKVLLEAIGVDRTDVAILPGAEPDNLARQRLKFISEAMRPAATTDKWRAYVERCDRNALAPALDGLNLIEAASAAEESEVVSLILREALETPGKTVALVTRDRLLARRVSVRLEAFGIRVDDSAGRPFIKTMPGTLLDLIAEAALRGFTPVTLMAVLRHPLARFGFEAGDIRRAARALELAVFRTTYLGRGLDGVRYALAQARARLQPHRALWRAREKDLELAEVLIERVDEAFAPLVAVFETGGQLALRTCVEAHIKVGEAVVRRADPDHDTRDDHGDDESECALWRGEAGTVAAGVLSLLIDSSLPDLELEPREYPDVYRTIVGQEVVRSRLPVHPRVSIWGPFEARLQQPDVVVLGGLNEGSWPEAADPGPWLNRPMRNALGLPQPEERIGYACHDFAVLLAARQVFLTRALKSDGTPTVPSRWLMRLRAVLDGLGLGPILTPDKPWLGWAANRSAVKDRQRIAPPQPCPPVALRPRALSVSDVERWVQNPYAIFAQKILQLEPLPVLGARPDAALRGSLVHTALSQFITRFGGELPEDASGALLEIAESVLGRWAGDERVAAFWVPRFERFADWFAATEAERRANVQHSLAEVEGHLTIDAPLGPFKLNARADRIDELADGLVITDYKTMSASALAGLARRALSGEAPQLLLEALIAQAGGFVGLGARPVSGLAYISASGGEPAGGEQRLDVRKLGESIERADKGLKELIAAYDNEGTAYAAVRRARFDYQYDSFAGLARVGEWAASARAEGGGA